MLKAEKMGRSREKDYDRAGMHRNLDIMSLLLQNIHSYHRELMSSVRHECVKGFAVNRIDDVIDCNWHQTLVLVDSAVYVKSWLLQLYCEGCVQLLWPVRNSDEQHKMKV